MENLYVDQETNPKPGYNVSLVPTLNCQEKVQMHWQDGRLLYKYVLFVLSCVTGAPRGSKVVGAAWDTWRPKWSSQTVAEPPAYWSRSKRICILRWFYTSCIILYRIQSMPISVEKLPNATLVIRGILLI